MEGRRLILADGTVIEDGTAGESGGFLWCWFSGYTLNVAAWLFFSPERTETIRFQYGEMEDVYEGYTECRGLSIDADGKISVCMTKAVANNG